jgi:cytochrome c oxidase subunit 1
MLYALWFLFLFTIGGLTGVFLGTLSVDVHLHDTYFVVAHFHYVMVGGTFMTFVGGLYYWWPKMFGRMYNETVARIAAVMVFLGFNLTFFVQFIMGSQGMPRRYHHYLEQFTTGHRISTVGAFLLGAGFFLAMLNLAHAAFRGKKATQNPWKAVTFEWTHASSPPIAHNFHTTPKLSHDHPYEYPAPSSSGAKGYAQA